jgi:hypothetical protein
MRQIRHYAHAEGVANGTHDDGYRCGGLLRREHGRPAAVSNFIQTQMHYGLSLTNTAQN